MFHEKLGTVADKVERVAKLAEWLASLEGTGLLRANPEQTEQAARLCKADLVTEMVGEFPELQGLMGGYYAEKQGFPAEVSHAIRDHYKPVGQGDDVPTDPVTVCVSLADKLDTLVGFFAIDEKPTGSKDPFALRRAMLSILSLISANKLRLPAEKLFAKSFEAFEWKASLECIEDKFFKNETRRELWLRMLREFRDVEFEFEDGKNFSLEIDGKLHFASGSEKPGSKPEIVTKSDLVFETNVFFADRLKVQQREAGVRHDLIDAVFALGGEDDLVRLLARVKALQAFVETPDGVNLLAGYKRASNILKKEGGTSAPAEAGAHLPTSDRDATVRDGPLPAQGNKPLSYTPETAEKALIDALDAAQPQVTAAIEAEQFETAMTALAALRGPIDQFFEDVTVNDEDESKREARLALLARFRDAVHQVADFSQIEG